MVLVCGFLLRLVRVNWIMTSSLLLLSCLWVHDGFFFFFFSRLIGLLLRTRLIHKSIGIIFVF